MMQNTSLSLNAVAANKFQYNYQFVITNYLTLTPLLLLLLLRNFFISVHLEGKFQNWIHCKAYSRQRRVYFSYVIVIVIVMEENSKFPDFVTKINAL